MKLLRVGELISEMHQFKNERTVLRLNTGQVLPRFDDHLRDADLVSVF
jgi:hypothetical protein